MKRSHLLARAVVLRDGHVLLAHQKGAENTFLPGGHIEFGEGAAASLIREIREELGFTVKVTGYLGAVEAEWEDDAGQHYEINHVFSVDGVDLDVSVDPPSREEHLEFIWSPLDELEKRNLLPRPMVRLIVQFAGGDRTAWWASTVEGCTELTER